LHFAGRFRADVSTVNNRVTHFQNPANPPGQAWNPKGSGSWSLVGCTITSAVLADGTVAKAAADDPVVSRPLAQSSRARLVDLDPQQQVASQIWGMQMRLAGGAGSAFSGVFTTVAFCDLWQTRARGADQTDFPLGAFYQSVLTPVTWGDVSNSRVLSEL